jgi:hypothetical protein
MFLNIIFFNNELWPDVTKMSKKSHKTCLFKHALNGIVNMILQNSYENNNTNDNVD